MNSGIIIYVSILILIVWIYLIEYNRIYKLQPKKIVKNTKKLVDYIQNYLKIVKNNNKTLFIIPHLELGDNLIINGMIRYYVTKYNVILVVKEIYKEQINIMYSDLLSENNKKLYFYYVKGGIIENIYLLNELPIDYNLKKLLNDNNIKTMIFNEYKSLYLESQNFIPINYPQYFYTDFNLDWKIQYTYFKINRNMEEENDLYNRLINITGEKYIVIIDDEKRNYIIDKKYIFNNFPIFKIGNNSKNKNEELNMIRHKNMFNYIKILENAHEIHSIDTSMLWLIDLLNIPGHIYLHRNIRMSFGGTNYKSKYIKLI